MQFKKPCFSRWLKGAVVSSISRVCNLVCFTLKKPEGALIHVHMQGFVRLYEKHRLLACSEDMYRAWDKNCQNFEWDVPGQAVFDHCINACTNLLYGTPLLSIEQTPEGDVMFLFASNLRVQCLNDTTEREEKVRIIDSLCHLVLYSDGTCETISNANTI